MRTLASEIQAEITKMNQPGRWAHLFTVTVDSTTTLHLTDYPVSLVYSSVTYTPYPIATGDIQFTNKPEMHSFTITVANIDRTIGLYLDQDKLLNNDVIITWVFVREADDTVVSAFSETYQILAAEINDDEASVAFEVGQYNLFKIKLPHNRWIDWRCEYVFKSVDHCHYGRDEFRGTSEADFKTTGTGQKLNGWWYINAPPALQTASTYQSAINYIIEDYWSICLPSTYLCEWKNSAAGAHGPCLYKRYDLTNTTTYHSDFDIETHVVPQKSRLFSSAGIIIATDVSDQTNFSNYIYWCHATKSNGKYCVQLRNVISDVWSTVYESAEFEHWYYLRVKKEGTTFKCYVATEEWLGSTEWQLLYTHARSDLNGVALRLGLTIGAGGAPYAGTCRSDFDYFRMTYGGHKICDHTMENCRDRGNISRYGGAPGILHGALQL